MHDFLNTVKPLNSGHLRVLKILFVIKRRPLLGGNLTKIVTFGTKLLCPLFKACPLLGGFTVYKMTLYVISQKYVFRMCSAGSGYNEIFNFQFHNNFIRRYFICTSDKHKEWEDKLVMYRTNPGGSMHCSSIFKTTGNDLTLEEQFKVLNNIPNFHKWQWEPNGKPVKTK